MSLPAVPPALRGKTFMSDEEHARTYVPPVPGRGGAERDPLDPPIFLLQASPSYASWLPDGVWQRVPIGSAGQVLTVQANGSVAWGAGGAGGLAFAISPSGDTSGATDTANLQGAIDAQWAAGGGLVLLPAGLFYITQIILRNGVSVWGSGEGSIFPDPVTGLTVGTILRAPLGSTSHMVIPDPLHTISSVQLRDFTLDGNNGPVPSAYAYTTDGLTAPTFTASGNSSAIGPPSYANGNPVQLSQGTPPTGMSNGVTYYVVNAGGGGTTFQLASSPGGLPIGSGGIVTGIVTGVPAQTPNAFDLIHMPNNAPVHVIRCKIQNVTLYGSPNDGLYMNCGSTGGSFVLNLTVNNAYAHGMELLSVSDTHFTNGETLIVGQNGIVCGGTQLDFANWKTNTSGNLGLGAGTQDGWHITGGSNRLIGAVSENDDPATGSGNGFYVSGNRNDIVGFASGATGTLMYLDGCVYNDIRLTISNSTNLMQPNYIYQINSGATKNNTVTIRGGFPGTTPVIAYANYTSGGTEQNNQFEVEGERTGSQIPTVTSNAITPDPYLGKVVQVPTLTAGMTVNNPANGHPGSELEFRFLQNGGGGNAVTFGTAYKISAAIPTTGSTATQIGFVLDSTGVWRETSRATA